MKKLHDEEDYIPRRRPQLMGPAAQAKALAEATAKLAARRQRDALPHRIETPRLALRAPIRGDVPDLVKLADNKAIAEKLSRLPSPYTRADAIGFVEIMAQKADLKPYAITIDNALIGVVSLSYHADKPPELGYWLGEPYWGQGFVTEAARGLIETATATGQYPRIGAWALKENERSINVLTKLRFKKLRESKSEDVKDKGRKLVHFIREQGR
jgi:RimJ/RimL family protein N-acetyltransferase